MPEVIKAVSLFNGQRLSWCQGLRRSKYCLSYEPGVLVRPLIGYLFAYEDMEWSLLGSNTDEIWLCQTSEVIRATGRAENTSDRAIENFWRTPGMLTAPPSLVLEGTVWCPDLTLKERIRKGWTDHDDRNPTR